VGDGRGLRYEWPEVLRPESVERFASRVK